METFTFKGIKYTTDQEAYACGAGSDSNYCAAHAHDENGNEVTLFWLIDRAYKEELSDIVSDWDVIDHVTVI